MMDLRSQDARNYRRTEDISWPAGGGTHVYMSPQLPHLKSLKYLHFLTRGLCAGDVGE